MRPLVHLHEHDALGIAVGGARLACIEGSDPLVQAGLKRQAKGLAQRAHQSAHDAPVMAPVVRGFTLGCTVLI